jgi:hypothetical protein
MPSLEGALSVRLVIEGTIVIIVPFIASFLLDAFSLLEAVFDSITCISVADNIMQVLVIPILPSAMFPQWSETAGRVPTWTRSVVRLLTPNTIIAVEKWVCDCGCIQHCLEALNLHIHFFVVFR